MSGEMVVMLMRLLHGGSPIPAFYDFFVNRDWGLGNLGLKQAQRYI